MKPQEKKKCIVVLGMHRSGTSALAGLLSHAGIDFGNNLIPPHFDNPTGYFEDKTILNINESILKSIRSSWYSIEPLKISGKTPLNMKNRLIQYLKRQISKSGIFGIKDPRIIRLFPIWKSVFKALGVSPCFIIIVRDVREVCESLRNRNCIGRLYSSVLWAIENLSCEKQTRGYKRVFLTYRDLLNNPVACINKIKDQLNLPVGSSANTPQYVLSFIKQSLNHSKSFINRDKFDIAPSILELSRFFTRLARAVKPNKSDMHKKLDAYAERIRSERDYKIALHYHGILEQQHTPRLQYTVFLDHGTGYSDSDSLSTPFNIGKRFSNSINLPSDPEIKSVKINPVNFYGILSNFKLRIAHNGKIMHFGGVNNKHFKLNNMIPLTKYNSFLSINYSPKIELPINAKKGSKIQVKCSFDFEPFLNDFRNIDLLSSVNAALKKERTRSFLKRLLNRC